MNGEQNDNLREIQPVNEEKIHSFEVRDPLEAVAEKEVIGDEEDNRNARSLNGEEAEEKNENDNNEESESSDSSNGASSSAGSVGSVAGAAGASIAAIAVVAIIITTAMSAITASFLKLEAFGTYIDYILTVSMTYEETEDQVVDFENTDTGLVLVVTKSGFSQNINLVTGDSGLDYSIEKIPIENSENKYKVNITFSGKIEGLEENTRYKLSVIGDEDGKTVTYTKKEVKTTARVSEIRGVSSYCTCDKDGKFNFTVDYTDENEFYSDFSYQFLDNEGEVVKSDVITDPKTEQYIYDVNELPGSEYTLVIQLRSVAETDQQAENVSNVYLDGAVTVVIDHGTVTIIAKVKI